jgi:hypothetical protein
MKRLNSVIVIVALAAGAASAQPPGAPLGGRFDLDDLAILLDLDAYQKGEVERVFTEQREARRAAREQRAETSEDERPSREEMLALREQYRDELFAKLQNTLTEQQISKLKILMQPSQRDGGSARRGGQF